jgi:hypothetical protein
MIAPAPPVDWLVPDSATVSPDRRIRMLPAGVLWDVLRTPEDLALPVLARLLADEDDRALLGPVLRDERARTVHWLVSRGHTAGTAPVWPEGCALRGVGGWLAVPSPKNPHSKLAWLHLPEPGTLTPPPWLAAALADQHATTDPHLGTP